MVYILTAQRHDVARAFARYHAYIESVRGELPAGAYALATSDWYFDFREHRAPHDAWLERVTVVEQRAASGRDPAKICIELRLLGAYHDGWIDLSYRDVSRYRIELASADCDRGYGHRDWRYDEFRLVPGRRVEHEIEWWGIASTGTWLIEAADVEFQWTPIGVDAERIGAAT